MSKPQVAFLISELSTRADVNYLIAKWRVTVHVNICNYLYIYVHVYMYTYIYVYIYIYIYIYMYACIYAYRHVDI